MNLKALAEAFEKHISNIVEKLQGKVVVFDFDGTMTEFHYAETRLLPCRDDDVYEYSKTHNIYANARMLGTMQYVISQLNPENVFVLTRTEKTLIDKKNECIYREFPSIKPENINHVQIAEKKLDVLRALHERFGTDVIFVEDTFKTILNAEESMPFVRGVHISSFLI